MTDAPPVRRRVLGAALRRFREQTGCTLDDAARILNCGRSKISRIETGQRGIRATELQELLAEYGVDELHRDALLSLAHQTRQDGWWQSAGRVRGDAYPDFAGLGGTGTTICTYDAQLLPGLLQTSDYARAIAAASLVEAKAQTSTRSSSASASPSSTCSPRSPSTPGLGGPRRGGPRQMVGGRDVMRAQLRHLIDISDRQRNVGLQVLPLRAGRTPRPVGRSSPSPSPARLIWRWSTWRDKPAVSTCTAAKRSRGTPWRSSTCARQPSPPGGDDEPDRRGSRKHVGGCRLRPGGFPADEPSESRLRVARKVATRPAPVTRRGGPERPVGLPAGRGQIRWVRDSRSMPGGWLRAARTAPVCSAAARPLPLTRYRRSPGWAERPVM